MDLLIFSQILFNIVASIAIIVLGVLFAIATYHLIHIMKHLQNIADNMSDASDELRARLEEIIDRLSSLPLFSYFLKTRDRSKKASNNKKRS